MATSVSALRAPFSYKVSRGWDGNYPLGDDRDRPRSSIDE